MEYEAISYGTRIKYIKDGHIMLSTKIYSNGYEAVRAVIDTNEMVFKLIDPVTGFVFRQSQKRVKNLEVLQRHVKKALCEYLNINFDKEVRDIDDE